MAAAWSHLPNDMALRSTRLIQTLPGVWSSDFTLLHQHKVKLLPLATGDTAMMLLRAAPVPWPMRVMRSASPPNAGMFSRNQCRPATRSISPKLPCALPRAPVFRKPVAKTRHLLQSTRNPDITLAVRPDVAAAARRPAAYSAHSPVRRARDRFPLHTAPIGVPLNVLRITRTQQNNSGPRLQTTIHWLAMIDISTASTKTGHRNLAWGTRKTNLRNRAVIWEC